MTDQTPIARAAKAAAWEEGRRAEETAWLHASGGHPVEEGDMCYECSTENPYRKDQADE